MKWMIKRSVAVTRRIAVLNCFFFEKLYIMSSMRYEKQIIFFLIIITFIVLIFILQHWLGIYYTNYDIDINTGRIRTTKNLLFYQISNEVNDSILTETISSFDENVLPVWKNVSTVVPGAQYYPYPSFHGAFAQMKQVEILWELYSFSDEAKKHMALCVLNEWQTNKNDYSAGEYIRKVAEIAFEKDKSEHGKLITVEDLEALDII